MARGREKAAVQTAPVEGRWELPEGWRWLRASQFSKIVGGGTPKNAADEANYEPNGIPWLTPADLSGYGQQTIGRGRRSLSAHGFANSSAKMLPAGAVLISSRAPVGYCAVASIPVSTNQGFRSLVLDEGIDPFFIRYYVLYSRDYLEEHASGTTFKELSGGALGELLFPIPPLETQRRIVARIDELFSELDDGETALARAREDLEVYRKALLKAAVTGELTADWRIPLRKPESNSSSASSPSAAPAGKPTPRTKASATRSLPPRTHQACLNCRKAGRGRALSNLSRHYAMDYPLSRRPPHQVFQFYVFQPFGR